VDYTYNRDMVSDRTRLRARVPPVNFQRAAFPLAAVALVLAATTTACSRTPRTATQRVAILGIDNLSGDASLDWIATAAPRIVASQLTGASGTTAMLATSASDAYADGATRFLHGYFDRRDAPATGAAPLHFEFRLEDAASHAMQDVIALNANPIQALDTLAHRIDPSAHAFSSSNQQAIEAFGRGEYERAVELDPDFSAAWLAWAQSLAATPSAASADQAASVTTRALAQPGLRSAADRSRLELLAASLTHDPEAELRALEGLASQSPTDPKTARALAEAAMNARQFTRAAKYYETLLRLVPGDPSSENLLGYAYAFAGDIDAAMKAFDAYRRLPGQEANALDSIGEAYFVNGRFPDAERFFLQAHDKDAAMLGGGDLLKAAYARYLAGRIQRADADVAAADQIFNRFVDIREQAKDPLLPWKKAVWFYGTGRADQARQTLESALLLPSAQSPSAQATPPPATSPQAASGQFAVLARRQLAVWKAPPVLSDLTALKRAYQSSTPSTDGLARTFYAAALLANGQKDQAQKLAAPWPLPDAAGDPVLQAFLYPRFLELREKLK